MYQVYDGVLSLSFQLSEAVSDLTLPEEGEESLGGSDSEQEEKQGTSSSQKRFIRHASGTPHYVDVWKTTKT